MSLLDFQVRKPNNARNTNHSRHVISSRCSILITRDEVCGSASESIAKPNLICLNKRENLLILDCVLMSYDDELLIVLDELGHIFPKERKRRVGDNNVGLFEKFYALL